MRIIKLDEYLAEKCMSYRSKTQIWDMTTQGAEKGDRWVVQGKNLSRQGTDTLGFPSITPSHEKTKRRILVQRNHQFSARHNVPPAGHEYDFRRTPDAGRVTPRCIRPCVPPDTLNMDALRLNDSPIHIRTKFLRDKLDIGRCPTPMPSESENYVTQPLPSARSAWDNVLGDNGDNEGQFELKPTTLPMNNKPFQDRMGRRFKPSTAPLKYDVIVSDIDIGHHNSPTPASPLNLTENVLQYYFQKPVNRDRRIAKWLVECEDKKQNQLPAHLPDISASNRNVTVTFEDL